MMSKEKTTVDTLDEKSIAAIANELEARLRQPVAAVQVNPQPAKKNGIGSKGVFFWGAASGLALAVAGPMLGRQARPAVHRAIKGGILASRYVQKTASGLKEDLQDIAAEAKADLDAERHSPGKESA